MALGPTEYILAALYPDSVTIIAEIQLCEKVYGGLGAFQVSSDKMALEKFQASV
jgi:hypothetical protein